MCTAVKSYRKPTGSSPYKGNTPPSHPATQPGLIHYANKAENPIEGTSWVNVVSLQNSILPKPDKSPTYLMIPWIWEQIWADESVSDTDNTGSRPSTHAFRRQTHQSPYLDIMYSHHPVRVTFDSGATGNKSTKLRGSSTKLRGSQWTLLPCEIEALAITVATKHFNPYLVQSHYEACILTKSKPCIQAYEKTLQRRVSSKPPCIYLSVHREPLSGFCKTRIWLCNTTFRFLAVQLRVTIKPARSVPSEGSPRILLTDTRQSKTYSMAMSVYLPFTSCTAWLATQAECPDLRATYKCIHREPLSGFCKTRIWLCHTTFRFFHSQSSSVWG